MKQGETLALNERIMLSLVSTGTPSPYYLGAKRILHISISLSVRIPFVRIVSPSSLLYVASQLQ